MENGYETISYGKIYHYPNDNGQYWSDNDGGAHQADYQDPEAQARKRGGEIGEHGRKGPAYEYPEVDDYAYNDGKVTMRALDKMKALKAENKPFFMWFASYDAHRVWRDNEFSGSNPPEKIKVPDYLIDSSDNYWEIIEFFEELEYEPIYSLNIIGENE